MKAKLTPPLKGGHGFMSKMKKGANATSRPALTPPLKWH